MFVQLSTQWRVGMGGATGLDYSAVHALFKINGVKKKKRLQYLDDIATMEYAALEAMRQGDD